MTRFAVCSKSPRTRRGWAERAALIALHPVIVATWHGQFMMTSGFWPSKRVKVAAMVARHAPKLTPCHEEWVALDIDPSPFDNSGTKKEGVSWTYLKFDGFRRTTGRSTRCTFCLRGSWPSWISCIY